MFSILKIEQKAATFRELATMVRAGMSLSEALHALETRRCYPRLKQAIVDAAQRIPDGTRLSAVLKDYPQEFSKLTVGVIAAGEKAGKLDEVLARVAEYLEREYSLRQLVSRETFYPKVLAVVVLLMPVATRAIIVWIQQTLWAALWLVIKTLTLYAAVVAIPVALIYIVYKAFTSTERGRYMVDAAKLRVPLLGLVIQRLALAKFSRALAYTYGAGLPLSQAAELAGAVSGNAAIAQSISAAVPHLRKGGKLSEVLAGSPDVDTLVVRMLQTGEQTGNIEETMERVAEHFELACESSIHRMAVLALPIGVIIVGIIVALMAISFYGSYYADF